jgi:hypothetical protein
MSQRECDKKQSQKNVETRAAIQTWDPAGCPGPQDPAGAVSATSFFNKGACDLSHQNCKGHIQRSIYVIGLRVSIVAQHLHHQRCVV